MAITALRGRGLIEQNLLFGDHTNIRVAGRAAHVPVRTLQREGRLLVIEQRRPPFRTVVTFRTMGRSCLGELPPMNIRVTFLTDLRRRCEIRIA